MSSSKQLPILQKKRKHGDVTEKVLCDLKKYQELSPTSNRLREKIFEIADKAADSDDIEESLLESTFEFFQEKQKQAHVSKKERKAAENERKTMTEKIKSLEDSMAQKIESLEKQVQTNAELRAEIYEFKFLCHYGDRLQDILHWYGKQEVAVQKEDREKIRNQYVEENKLILAQAKQTKMAEAKANKTPYQGPGLDWGKINESEMADKDSEWECITKRYVTSTQEKVNAEKAKIEEWRAAAGHEDTTPATPFLDRLQPMCELHGVSRTTVLIWVKEYSERNELCHKKPPEIENYWKTKEKEDVKVELEEEDPTKGFDWSSFEAAIKSYKPDIEERHANGEIDEERRDIYLGIIDAYKSLYFADENGTLTDYAKGKAQKLWPTQKKSWDPPTHLKKRYKTGKWDDI